MSSPGGRAATVLLLTALTFLASAGPAAADNGKRSQAGTLVINTVPPTPGARFSAEGKIVRADSKGVARLPVRRFTGLATRFHVLTTKVSKDESVVYDRMIGTPDRAVAGRPFVVGLRTRRLVRFNFVDRGGKVVTPDRVASMTLKSSTGETLSVSGAGLTEPHWLAASRTQQTPKGLVSKHLYWSVSSVVVDGAEVVNKGQQVFIPNETRQWTVALLFYRVKVQGRDLLFGATVGKAVELHRPDGEVVRADIKGGEAVLPEVPRGQYDVRIAGSGLSFLRPVSISKDQTLEVQVVTPADMWLAGTAVASIALSLILVGRRRRVVNVGRRVGRAVAKHTVAAARRRREAAGRAAVIAVVAASLALGALAQPPRAARAAPSPSPTPSTSAAPTSATPTPTGSAPAGRGRSAGVAPVLAYYYIWYNPTSWQRAKKDYPLLGRYASDDTEVMRRHVSMAKSAGLTGFLVSWKHTESLDNRLAQLIEIARKQAFKLGIVYQGLDFRRQPLPPARIAEDLRYLADEYGADPVFDIFGKPVVVITGTESFTVPELKQVIDPVRNRLLVLASAKSVEDYERVAPLLDGDAYYWSSGDPTSAAYTKRLQQIGAAVHAHGGLWLPPAGPGFDARLIGGRLVVPRRGGETLRLEFAAARSSEPDAVAVISWNEFSENSHVEPSEVYGTEALRTLASILGAKAQIDVPVDSSDPGTSEPGLTGWGAIVALLLAGGLLNIGILLRRRRTNPIRAGPEGLHRDGHHGMNSSQPRGRPQGVRR